MSNRRHWLLNNRHVLAHCVHLVVVLLPTFVLAGLHGIGWSVACFAVGISAAAVLESRLVTPSSCATDAQVQDVLAMRVASLVGGCLLAIFWTAQVECCLRPPKVIVLQVVGAFCLPAGIALRMMAIRALGGRFVSDIRVERDRVRDGIYTWLRHPSEIGLLLIAVGGPLLLGAPWTALAATLLLLPLSLWRVHRENVAWTSLVPRPHGRLSPIGTSGDAD